jgi:uncharacterized membrane protein YphA (DoxX/SURF4 family)
MNKTNQYISYFYLSLAVILTVVGFMYEAFDLLYSLIVGSLFLLSLLPLFLKEKGLNFALFISRVFVGSLFVVSGLIKANDTLGFSYKLEEYFAESALGWTVFEPYSLFLSIIIASSEVILGFAVLFGGKSKLTNWLLLSMILFFSWLTLYTAQCDPTSTYKTIENGVEIERTVTCVTDCGCFGDALKGSIGRSLTPWESFKKDILLLWYVLLLLINSTKINLNTQKEDSYLLSASMIFVAFFGGWLFSWWFPLWFTLFVFILYFAVKKSSLSFLNKDWQIALMVALVSFGFSLYTLNYLPQKDFRPYAVGKNLPEQMKSAEELGLEAPLYVYDYTLEHKQTGELKKVRSDIYMSERVYADTMWTFKESGESYKLKDGYEPPIMGFGIGDDEQTEKILNSEKPIFLLISYDVNSANKDVIEKIHTFVGKCNENDIEFLGATSSLYNDIEAFKKQHQLSFEFYSADEKILKTIIRSNPGLVLIQNGTILGKWHYHTFPEFEAVQQTILKK